MDRVAVVDYGLGNLFSMERALRFLDIEPLISADPRCIRKAGRIILPGVGAFGQAMSNLKEKGLDEAICETMHNGAVKLGICLGMQLLMTESEEHGLHKGLDLVPGRVMRFPSGKVPQVGWNELLMPGHVRSWEGTLLQRVPSNSAMYFVHSYMAAPEQREDILAETVYEDIRYPSVIKRTNIYGCQFHPEKSARLGLDILKKFMEV
ncbi:MAG: imidazole glycerol phosphate synthase subunit HisH [Deltaproteobacteria bacterium]|nr:imidazole glycerol phosphate synthase subunit HisH [Deltaproteobacteria bacterium]